MKGRELEIEYELAGIEKLAREIWSFARDRLVYALHGEMGAGKTTLVHALCDARGVREPVTSPTFSLINEYRFLENGKEHILYHIDLFRIADFKEAVAAGMEDCIYSGNICMVEWPDKAPALFPPDCVHLYLSVLDTTSRRIIITLPA